MWLVFMILGAGGAIAWDRYVRDRRSVVIGRQELDVSPNSAANALPETRRLAENPPTNVARGGVSTDKTPAAPRAPRRLPSPIGGISDVAWTKFCNAMKTQGVSDVSSSNAVGMFEMMPRRLVDLGLVGNMRRIKSPRSGRTVFVGEFVPPLTEEKFTSSPLAQYNAFVMSMQDYAKNLRGKGQESPNVPGMTLSGALAVLHRCGPNGLKTWASSKDKFPATCAAYDRVNGIF